jgi:hypothetical protein
MTTLKAVTLIGGPYHQRREIIDSAYRTPNRKRLGILVGCDFASQPGASPAFAYSIIGPDKSGNLLAISVAGDV